MNTENGMGSIMTDIRARASQNMIKKTDAFIQKMEDISSISFKHYITAEILQPSVMRSQYFSNGNARGIKLSRSNYL
jgi:hypothetical protein